MLAEYVRLVDAGLIEVKPLAWSWSGLIVIGMVFVWLVWSAARARAKVGRGFDYNRRKRRL